MIYLDYAATTPINEEVLKSFNQVMNNYFANPASSHALGIKSALLEKKAREQIASLLRVEENEIIFTSGATESNNLAIKGCCLKYRNRGNHIITSKVEHASVLNAFKQLEDEFNFKVTYLEVDEFGKVSLESLKNALTPDTFFVSIMAVNNEVGTINDIEAMGKLLKKYPKIIFHSDATQAIGKIEFDYSNCDLISMSAHKINGFKGSGLLIKKKNIDPLPLLSGGGQEQNIRSGTNNFPYEVALAKTLRIALEKQKVHFDYVQNLNEVLRQKLLTLNGVKINSPLDASPYILSFSVNKKASVVSEYLSIKEIYVSTKSACSSKKSPKSYVLQAMGRDDIAAENVIRISLSHLNNLQEIEIFINELKNALNSIK